MPMRYIFRKGQRYYYNGTYEDIKEARRIANYYRKKRGSRYFIINEECGFLTPHIKRHLYLTKVFRL